MSSRQNDDSGFTLLEVLVALAIFSIGVVLVIQLFSAGVSSARNSKEYTKAVIYARQKASEAIQDATKTEGRTTGVSADGLIWMVEVSRIDMLESNSPIKLFKVITRVKDSKGKNMVALQTIKTVSE